MRYLGFLFVLIFAINSFAGLGPVRTIDPFDTTSATITTINSTIGNVGTVNSTSVATKKASVAGGYITSQNKVDGSFEDGTTGWSASVGTIVKTANAEMQGNYVGVWSGVGVGNLDLLWTATASNTYELSAQIKLDVPSDYTLCGVVNGTETGCKVLSGYVANKIYKASVIADSVLGTSFYLRLKHTGSDAFSVKVDDGKIEPQAFQNVQVVEQGGLYHNAKASTMVQSSGDLGFNLSNFSYSQNFLNLFTVENSSNVTRLIAKKYGQITNANLSGWSNSADLQLSLKKNTIRVADGQQTTAATTNGTLAAPVNFSPGDVISFYSNIALTGTADIRLSIAAQSITDSVIQSYQDGTEWTSYTPTFNGFGTPTSVDFKWKKEGSDVLISGYFVTGVSTAVQPYFTLPGGLTPVVPSVLKLIGFAHVGVGSIAGYANTAPLYVEPSSGNPRVLFQKASTAVLDYETNATIFAGLNQKISINARIPIAGWSSSPTLLALPVSKENVFSAKISSTGTILSQNAAWIASITKTGTGLYTIVPKSLTTAPVVLSLYSNGGDTYTSSERVTWVRGTPTASEIKIGMSGGGAMADNDFFIAIQKQSPDYTAPGGFVGNVAKNQVALVSYDSSATRLLLSTNAQDIPFNRVHGVDSSIVSSLDSGKFKLQAGTYDISWFAQHRVAPSSAAIMRTYLFNVTDGIEVESGSLNGGVTPSVSDIMGSSIGSSAVTITSEKAFVIRAINSNGTGSNYIGDNIASPFSLKAQVKITKLNGQ